MSSRIAAPRNSSLVKSFGWLSCLNGTSQSQHRRPFAVASSAVAHQCSSLAQREACCRKSDIALTAPREESADRGPLAGQVGRSGIQAQLWMRAMPRERRRDRVGERRQGYRAEARDVLCAVEQDRMRPQMAEVGHSA